MAKVTMTADGDSSLGMFDVSTPITVYVDGNFDGGTITVQGKPQDSTKGLVSLGSDVVFSQQAGYGTVELYGQHELNVNLAGTSSNSADLEIIALAS